MTVAEDRRYFSVADAYARKGTVVTIKLTYEALPGAAMAVRFADLYDDHPIRMTLGELNQWTLTFPVRGKLASHTGMRYFFRI